MDEDPLPDLQQTTAGGVHGHIPENGSSPEFSLVLRPDIDSDEHLLPIHEGPWTPDGNVWYYAKISFLQGNAATSAAETEAARGHDKMFTAGASDEDDNIAQPLRKIAGSGEGSEDQLQGAGLSFTLRPEGAVQRIGRLEREASEEMTLEDHRSRLIGQIVARLEREAKGRHRALKKARALSRLSSMILAAKVNVWHSDSNSRLLCEPRPC